MSRMAREKSESGIYHIILRGANRQQIFHQDEDSQRFMQILEKYSKGFELRVYSWCLMSNHIHLLLREGNEELSVTMKRIGVSFAWYYNWKYRTNGHLFQDRFRSEKIDSEQYLLAVIRYIHQNPVKAGMVERVEDWKWSSCQEYYAKRPNRFGLLDRDFVLDIFSLDDKQTALAKFKEYNQAESNDQCLDDYPRVRLTDEEATEKIIELIGVNKLAQLKSLPKLERNEVLREAKGIKGITQRQAARILGVSESLVFKA